MNKAILAISATLFFGAYAHAQVIEVEQLGDEELTCQELYTEVKNMDKIIAAGTPTAVVVASDSNAVAAAQAANEAAIARLPEKVQKVVPVKYDPFELRDWLDAAAPELTNFAAVQTDGQQGARPDRASAVLAVDEDTATLAKLLGIDPQVLLKEVKKER